MEKLLLTDINLATMTDIDLVKDIIYSATDLNIINKWGLTALHMCIGFNNIEVFQLLLDAGADLCIKDKSKRTPLDLAINAQNDSFIKMIEIYQNYRELNNSLSHSKSNKDYKHLKL